MPQQNRAELVNDGGLDASNVLSLDQCRRGPSFAGDPSFKVVDLSWHFNHQVALSEDFAYCADDLTVPLDVDLQDPPDVICASSLKMDRGRCTSRSLSEQDDMIGQERCAEVAVGRR